MDDEVLWIVVVSYILAFFLACGVGANDVANSFGTSVGSKVLTLRQACIIASIFEVLGAVMLGSKVSETVRKGILDINMYNNSAQELMLGNMAALGGSAIWNIVATFFKMPISGTHSIIGAVIGFSLVAKGLRGIQWVGLAKIIASWFISPLLSGIMSICFYMFVSYFVLKKEMPLEPGLKTLPFFYGLTIFINIFSIVHDGPSFLKFNLIPWWGVLILSAAICFLVAAVVQIFVVPHIRRKALQMGEDKATSLKMNPNQKKEIPETTPINEGMAAVSSIDQVLNHEKSDEDGMAKDKKMEAITEYDKETKEDSPEVCQLFSPLQVLTAIFGSFVHGGNDVSNCVGPLIAVWLIYKDGAVMAKSSTPIYLLFYGGIGISVGLWIWGRRVIETMGTDLTTITPSSGFTIEIGAAFTVLIASKIGLPVSTTHCKVGSVVLVGRIRSKNSVDWSLFRNIALAWLVTLPISAGITAILMAILRAVVMVA